MGDEEWYICFGVVCLFVLWGVSFSLLWNNEIYKWNLMGLFMETVENVALFDMDGTICDYVGALHREMKKLLGPGEKFVDPFLAKDVPGNQYLWDRMHQIKASEDWWANLPRLSLGFEVMEEAKRQGYISEILTQAPRKNPAALAGKLRWLLDNVDEDMDFTMTRNKSRHYGRVLVDDYPGFAVPWLDRRPRGIVIMPSSKYNKDFTHPRVIKYNGKNMAEVSDGLRGALLAA